MSASKIAAQMYTVRDFTKTPKGLASTLKKLSKIGYRAVQLSAIGCMDGEKPQVSAREARKMLDDNGIRCVATHRSWDGLTGQTQAEIDFHQELDCDFTAIGGLPDAYWKMGVKGWSKFTQDVQPLLRRLKAAGIRFGYHNHTQEFVRTSPGKTTYDILIEKGGPDLHLEVDVYWATRAGMNPVKIFERIKDRAAVIHVKDGEVVRKDIIWDGSGFVMAPIGEGNLDWDSYLPAFKKANVEWYAVEQDECRRDAFDCMKSSYDYLKSKGA